jgi:hypothetical protein
MADAIPLNCKNSKKTLPELSKCFYAISRRMVAVARFLNLANTGNVKTKK